MTGNKKTGFTMIELIVSIAVFGLVVSSASGLFAFSLKLQRTGIAQQQLIDQSSYLIEYISRAVRMARKDLSGVCAGTAKLNYDFSGGCLKFRNYKGQCQSFCLVGGRIQNETGDYLTSNDLEVLSFNVSLSGQTQNDDVQPKVFILLDVRGKENSKMQIQTAISQRNLDVQK